MTHPYISKTERMAAIRKERAAIRRAGGGHSLAKLVVGGKTIRCTHGNTPATCLLCVRKLP